MADSEETRRALRRRVPAEERLLLVVAGPHGAGTSPFVETVLKPTGILVVNPDEVAKGLAVTGHPGGHRLRGCPCGRYVAP
jgi:hypothetical protein